MAQASRDQNFVPTLLGVSNADGATPVRIYADPITHRLLVDIPGVSGDVVGPGSSTDNAVVRFDGTTGKLIQNSGVIVDDSNNITGAASLMVADNTSPSSPSINFGNIISLYRLSGTNLAVGSLVEGFASLGANGINIENGLTVGWGSGNLSLNPDVAISRLGVNSLALGNGTAGDTTGRLTLGNLTIASLTGLLKASSGVVSTATAGTDYLVPASALTTGSVLFANGSGQAAQDNSNLFWDNTSKFLGIGTNSPSLSLDVAGNAVIGKGASNGTLTVKSSSNTVGTANVLLSLNNGTEIAQLTGQGPSAAGTTFGISNANLTTFAAAAGDFLVYSANTNLYLGAGGAVRQSILSNGNVGIGLSPTAVLHLKAGTATANTAPLKLTSGTNLSSIEDGAMEYNGSHLYFSIGATRYQLDQQGGGTPGGSNTQLQYNNSGAFGGISGATTDGTKVTLTAPILGTPTSGTLTNCTGYTVANLSGAGTGVLTALGVNVGSAGAFITFNGALGTPSSGTLTNATGLPISTGVSGLGTGVATFLATPSSANLAAALTDETGSGAAVFGTSPTITTPTINQINASSNTSISLNAGSYNTIQTYTPAGAGTATLDLSKGNIHHITMPAGNITIALSNGTAGQCFMVRILQDSGGSRTVTWFTTIKWAGGSAPTLTTTASKADTMGFEITGSNTYDGFVIGQNI